MRRPATNSDGSNSIQRFRDIRRVLGVRPNDPAAEFYYAGGLLAMGNAAQAREEYTYVLTCQTDLGDGYLGRAMACAELGEANRARADLQIAQKLGAKDYAQQQPRIAKELASLESSLAGKTPQQWQAALDQAVRTGTSDQVDAAAMALQKSMNAQRLRCDETYQDRLRVLEDAVRARPADVDALANLGMFLYQESSARGEALGPRAQFHTYRRQTTGMEEAELTRAEGLFDRVLAADPKNLTALLGKAGVRIVHVQFADAETLLRQAMAIQPSDPRVLSMFAQVMQIASFQKSSQAGGLRTVKTWSDLNFIYTRWPSQAELAHAQQLDRQSQQLVQLAHDEIVKSAQLTAGTARGFWYSGQIDWDSGNLKQALADFQKSVQLDPSNIEAQANLLGVERQLGMDDDAQLQQSVVANLVQTTSTFLLQPTWDLIPRTAYRSAATWLDRARAADPADARVAVYLGVVAEGEKNTDDAIADYRVASALEEARVRLEGTSLEQPGTTPLDPADVGLALVARLRGGLVLNLAKRFQDALPEFNVGVALEPRLASYAWSTPVPTAMLPDVESSQDPQRRPRGADVRRSLGRGPPRRRPGPAGPESFV